MHMKQLFIRIKLNRSAIIKSTLAAVGSLYTIWGFVSLFEPLNGLFCDDTSVWIRLGVGLGVLLGITIIAFISCSIYYLRSDCTCVLTSNSGKKVYVKYGDICSSDIIKEGYSKRMNVVIPVNRCFDTIVDDSLISQNTLHGKIMKDLYKKGTFDPDTLNDKIQESLSQSKYHSEILTVKKKPSGNIKRYTCGAVAEIKVSDCLTYFFLGLTTFNESLTASATKKEFAEAVQRMIEFCNARAQGYPVVLPLMGTGLSRTNIKGEDALNYLVSAFRINIDIINNDFYIVVWKGLKDKISIMNL